MKTVKKVMLGAAASLAAYLALLAVVSALVVRGTVGESGVNTCLWAGACFSALIGASLAMRRGAGDAAAAAECAAAFWSAVLLLGFLAYGELSPRRVTALLLPIFAGSALAYLTCRRGGKRDKGRRRFKK